jgi:type II secretory pathway pseudopilin PulG
MEPRIATGERSRGFTYLSLLFFVAVLSIGLVAVAISWQTSRQREKEAELLFAGAAFREGIARYYNSSPGDVPTFPKRLDDLLQDPRYPDTRRYLRRVYADPMSGERKWGTITAPDGGIMGVYSLSTGKPLKVAGAVPNGPDFGTAASYANWQFVYLPEALSPTPGSNAPPSVMDPAASPALPGAGAHQ